MAQQIYLTCVNCLEVSVGNWNSEFECCPSLPLLTHTNTHTHTLPSNTHTYSHMCTYAVTGTFLNTLKFTVKDCDPNTGEPDEEVGFDDEYVVRDCYRWVCVLVYFTRCIYQGNTVLCASLL